MILFSLAVLLTALSGVPGLFLRRGGAWTAAAMLGLGAISGLVAAGLVLCGSPEWTASLPAMPLGTRGMLKLDAIGSFFLLPVLLLPAAGSVFSVRYWGDHQEGHRKVRFFYGLLTAFLAVLVAAVHAITFLLAWEGMALTAFVLVITEDREPDTQRAGWIYLIATHTGTLCLIGAFALMASGVNGYQFSALPTGFAASGRGTAMFVLFLLGFGCKAGIMPLHFWLPPAHAAAPSHVSSLMSGVLIKMGILGLIRILACTPDPPLWWGGCLVILGLVSGILGVAFALGQHDLKRLLAYHSIENIGIILMGIGLGTVGRSTGHPMVAVLGYAGGLLHVINHSLFKGLLFLTAGSVVHATGTRNLEQMGGLGQRMPHTAGAFLVGAWAICGLPPLNGFVSEWLIYMAAFSGMGIPRWPWSVAILAGLAVIGALALACFAKAFAAVFLGQSKSSQAAQAVESPSSMLAPLGFLAIACGLLGVVPALITPALDRVVSPVMNQTALPAVADLVNLRILSGLAAALLAVGYLLWKWMNIGSSPRDVPTWDCGYAAPSARMQYTASSFADGFTSRMQSVLMSRVHWRRIADLFPRSRHFRSHVPDPVLDGLASPGLDLTARGLALLRFLQGGQLPLYLLYVLLTLLALLIWKVA